MIKTAKQLKDKVRNLSGGDTQRSQMLIRTFMMERFLERVSVSPYKDNFILKGGMLVSAFTGIEMRTTMDIDTTIKAAPLTLSESLQIVETIAAIDIDDGIAFYIISSDEIMEGHEYPGIRFKLEGTFDGMRQPIKIDITTGDVITPNAVEFAYKLMFEDRTILLMSYNMETLLAEKMETILSRGIANTRMRDFYDIYILLHRFDNVVDYKTLEMALYAVCEKRKSVKYLLHSEDIMRDIEQNNGMQEEWDRYQKANFYVGDIRFHDVFDSIKQLLLHTVI